LNSKKTLWWSKMIHSIIKYQLNLIFLQKLECLDVGKPLKLAYGDVEIALKNLRYNAGWADNISGRTPPVDGTYFSYTRIEAVGVVGAILPVRMFLVVFVLKCKNKPKFQWNLPLYFAVCRTASAIAAGCTLVIKPAEQTPLSPLYAFQISVRPVYRLEWSTWFRVTDPLQEQHWPNILMWIKSPLPAVLKSVVWSCSGRVRLVISRN